MKGVVGWLSRNFLVLVNVAVGLLNAFCFYLWTAPSAVLLHERLGLNVHDEHYRDVMQAAVAIGRLDGISVLLTIIGLLLALFAFAGFGYVRFRAEVVAKETANDVTVKTLAKYRKEDTETPSREALQILSRRGERVLSTSYVDDVVGERERNDDTD